MSYSFIFCGLCLTVACAQLEIEGTELGNEACAAFTTVVYNWLDPSLGYYPYRTPACNVSVAHQLLNCSTVPGQGHDLSFAVEVGGQMSNTVLTGLKFAAPVLGSSYPQIVNTRGGELVTLTGVNFGPAESRSICYAVYAEEKILCNVTSDAVAECRTHSGVGANWTVEWNCGGQFAVPLINGISYEG
jgi:hypothetical protein